MSTFQIVALEYAPFRELFSMSAAQLRAIGASRQVASSNPGFPCRVSLKDAQVGEEVILLHHEHHAVDSPYRSSGPIFVRRDAREARLAPGELPDCLPRRLLSLRAYDADHMMVAATVCEGAVVADEIERHFAMAAVAYIHLHNAKPGCFSCAVHRVPPGVA